MGQRSRTETLCAIFAAFLTHRRWSQADLARHVGVRTEALRKTLEELVAAGIPLVGTPEHPHVVWRVPKDWFPGGVLFVKEDVPELLRQLARLRKSKGRERLMEIVVAQLPLKTKPTAPSAVIAPAMSEEEEQYLSVVEDAARRTPLVMSYLTASRGTITKRHASVHAVEVGPPARFVATCHTAGVLRTFRVDAIVHARVDGGEPFRACDEAVLAKYRAESIDGFHAEGPAVEHSFFVREPEARWVVRSLLPGMTHVPLPGGVRVLMTTAGLLQVARYVVRLGEAAQAEDAALLDVVEVLARGALARSAERRKELAVGEA